MQRKTAPASQALQRGPHSAAQRRTGPLAMRKKTASKGDRRKRPHKLASHISKGGLVPKNDNVELLTVPEFLTRARISRSTFYALVRQRHGPPLIKIGSRTFIERGAGEAWILSRQTAPRAKPSQRPKMGDKAVSQTGRILRSLAPASHLVITLALESAGELALTELAARTGLPPETIRMSLPDLRGVVAAQRTQDGDMTLRLASAEVATLISAVRQFYDSVA